MGKPGRDRAPNPVNPGDSATRQEAWFEKPPTRRRWGAYYLARPGSPPGPKGVYYPKPQTSNLIFCIFGFHDAYGAEDLSLWTRGVRKCVTACFYACEMAEFLSLCLNFCPIGTQVLPRHLRSETCPTTSTTTPTKGHGTPPHHCLWPANPIWF